MTSIDFSQAATRFMIAFIPAVFGIICHEVAHGWVAYKLGDNTAKQLGRLSLNPIRHVDPMGLMVFVFTAIASPFVIGWAKPVPIMPQYFRQPREGMVFVSVAGPVANFLVALLCAFILRLVTVFGNDGGIVTDFITRSAEVGIFINCGLAWFNLMPVPPLDGSHIVASLMPRWLAMQYESLGRYGMLIIIALLYFKVFSLVLRPLIMDSVRLIMYIAKFL